MITWDDANVRKKLKEAETNTIKATEESLEYLGQVGVGYVKQSSPTITGRLKNSFGYSIAGKVEMSEAQTSEDKLKPNPEKRTLVIGTNVIYAARVEYLSKTGSKGFFQRAVNQLRQVAKQTMADRIKKGVG